MLSFLGLAPWSPERNTPPPPQTDENTPPTTDINAPANTTETDNSPDTEITGWLRLKIYQMSSSESIKLETAKGIVDVAIKKMKQVRKDIPQTTLQARKVVLTQIAKMGDLGSRILNPLKAEIERKQAAGEYFKDFPWESFLGKEKAV